MSSVFDNTIEALSKSMDLHLLRHAIIVDNIANAETPNFKARRVEFENELEKAISAGESRQLASVHPIIYEDAQSEMGQDLNTVDMDREMAELNKNELKYSALTQAISKKFEMLKYAVMEGNGK